MANDKEAILQELRDRTPKSGEYWEQSKDLIPGGLMSGARSMEPYPVYVERGKGAYSWDIDGNRYIDCAMSFGVHVLGHGPSVVLKALQEAVRTGHELRHTAHQGSGIYATVNRVCALCRTGHGLQYGNRVHHAGLAPHAGRHQQAQNRQVRGLLPRMA